MDPKHVQSLVTLTGQITALLVNAMQDAIEVERPSLVIPPDLMPVFRAFRGEPCDCGVCTGALDDATDSTPDGTPDPDDVEVVYSITGPPPTDHKVTDGIRTWQRRNTGMFRLIASTAAIDKTELESVRYGVHDRGWANLLDEYGPLKLVPLTDADRAEAVLYGPPGARWGDPDQPCPYPRCVRGLHHALAHIDEDGYELGLSDWPGWSAEAQIADVAVTLADAVADACTCGHPDAHQEGCPRYARLLGPRSGDTCLNCGWPIDGHPDRCPPLINDDEVPRSGDLHLPPER